MSGYLTREAASLKHYGVLGMRWGVRKVRSPEQFRKDLLSDSQPKNVDHPVHPNDRPTRDGTTSEGHFFQHYVTPDNYLYVKISNGDKRYSDRPGPSATPLRFMSITGKEKRR